MHFHQSTDVILAPSRISVRTLAAISALVIRLIRVGPLHALHSPERCSEEDA